MRKENVLSTICGVIGGGVSNIFGGWSEGVSTLLLLMALDWVTGLMIAGVFHTSRKTENGALSSSVGLKGICKKVVMLFLVIIAYRFDVVVGTSYIRDAVVIALIVNESISILENASLMGIPVPKVLTKMLEVLKEKAGESLKKKGEKQ